MQIYGWHDDCFVVCVIPVELQLFEQLELMHDLQVVTILFFKVDLILLQGVVLDKATSLPGLTLDIHSIHPAVSGHLVRLPEHLSSQIWEI